MKLLLIVVSFSVFLVTLTFTSARVTESVDDFDDEFHILVSDQREKAKEAKRLKEVEAQINEENEKFAKGEASFEEKLYPFSDLSKEEFDKEKKGLLPPPEDRDLALADNRDSCLGGDSCCQWNGYRCGEGEGDCDSDFDCKLGLVCGKDNCKNPKNITDGMGFDATDDCCYRPCFGGDSCCGSNGYQCGEGEGDCDYDSDCKPGLVCGKDNCKNPDIHPDGAGYDATDDCCILPH